MIKKEKNCVKHPPVFSLNYDIHDLLFFFLEEGRWTEKEKEYFCENQSLLNVDILLIINTLSYPT